MFGGGYDQTNQSHGLILHPNCPFDYTVSITCWYFPSTTQTCSVHTTGQLGLLCGHCKESYSLVLSTFQCVDNSMQCSNNYLALIIIFALHAVTTATIRPLTLVMEQLGKEEAQSATVVNADRTQVVEGTSTTLIVVVVMSNICVLLDVIALVC